MPNRKPLLTQTDYNSLKSLLSNELMQLISDRQTWLALQMRLETARVVPDERIPAMVVTMQSVVQLRSNAEEAEVFRLVYPTEADIASGQLSVITPIGVAILGRQVGQAVLARIPSGQRRVAIEELIYQPAAALHSRQVKTHACQTVAPWSHWLSPASVSSVPLVDGAPLTIATTQ